MAIGGSDAEFVGGVHAAFTAACHTELPLPVAPDAPEAAALW